MSVNKVILIGRLGQDPEVRTTTSGSVANLNLATNEVWTDKSGQRQERTEWHRVVVWGKQADHCKQYLSKGREVYIEGSLQTRQWDDKDGQKRYTTEVRAQSVKFLGGGGARTDRGAQQGAGTDAGFGASSSQSFSQSSAMPSGVNESGPSFTEDDIPF